MKKYIFLLTILFSFIFPSILFAQDAVTTSEVANKIEVEIYKDTQSVLNKKVPLTVKFRTNFDSDNVEISWTVPYGLELQKKHKEFVTAKAGETYVYKALIDPKRSGEYDVSVKITAWQYNTNYVSSANTKVAFDEELIVTPKDPSYATMTIIKWVVVAVMIGVLGYGGLILVKKFSKAFMKWFNPPI